MGEIASLVVNAATGLIGALIGAGATLKATQEAHRRNRAAAKDDAAKSENEQRLARAWQLTHAVQMHTAAIRGAWRGVVTARQRAPEIRDQDLWQVLLPAQLVTAIEPLTADQLAVLFKVGKSDLVNDLLELQDAARGISALLDKYSELRTQLTDLHHELIGAGASTEVLCATDLRFTGVVMMAQNVWARAESDQAKAISTAKKFGEAMKPYHLELGIKFQLIEVTVPASQDTPEAAAENV